MTDTVEHYIFTPRDPRAYDTLSLCGQRVRLDSPPPVGSPRCDRCGKGLDRVADAQAYAMARLITLPEAARALNLPSLIIRECEDRIAE